MRKLSMLALMLTSLAALPAAAAEAKIDIISPADGSKIKAGMPSQLAYEVTLGGGADHAHLYVDGKMAGLLRQKKGSHTLDPLTPGMHGICARLVDKNHTPTGMERCIEVTAE
ncbi:hypothetical protein [Candidatus Ferrigenium straubiae]|uniref:hypothetical protein n=1 Tax=Candidatus Ferrigenium straubiae TaxID=2919506 RepID=UPI003F4AB880